MTTQKMATLLQSQIIKGKGMLRDCTKDDTSSAGVMLYLKISVHHHPFTQLHRLGGRGIQNGAFINQPVT